MVSYEQHNKYLIPQLPIAMPLWERPYAKKHTPINTIYTYRSCRTRVEYRSIYQVYRKHSYK